LKPFWHPLSTVLLCEPRCFATDGLVRLLLGSEGRVRLLYAGDRMWPAVPHGTELTIGPLGNEPEPGSVVLASRSGIPDLARVTRSDAAGVTIEADADPELVERVPRAALLGRADLPFRRSGRRRRALRRAVLDLREAWGGRPDACPDPAESVRDKYENQATHYARVAGPEIEPVLLARIRDRLPVRGSLLVLGSGAGRESFALAEAAFRVDGVEFSESMVGLAREEAARRRLEVRFHHADLRRFTAAPGAFDGVLFTYDVYSFLPGRRERVELLRRIAGWLRPGGVVFLSARRLRSAYERLVLLVQWLVRQRVGETEWGDSHTRWIPSDGRMRRSYVHVFSPAQLRVETEAAGFRAGPWVGGHGVLAPDPAAIIRGRPATP
jgi:SAM-dependent methyltransferase